MVREQYPNLHIIEVDSIKEGLQLLSDKRVFGYIDSLEVIAYHVTQLNYLNIKVSSTLPLQYNLSFGIRSDWPEWVPIFDKALKTINQKQFNEIYNNWVAIKFQQGFDYRLIATILAIIIVFIAFLLYRYKVTASYNTKLSLLNQQLERQATTDQLTQIPNRYRLNQEVQRTVTLAKRFDEDVSMVLFDIDYFKDINDEFGHQIGDQVLTKVSQTMRSMIREVDTIGRWGGEEFLLICPKTNLEGATNIAHKIRERIQGLEFSSAKSVTLSAGVAQFQTDENYEAFLKRLDDALYCAKNSGRNQVGVAENHKKTQ
jgi:polar amino acid transport system substrate-binding protein